MNNTKDVRTLVITYLDAFWRSRRLVLIIMLCTPFLALFLYSMMTKRYEASISLAAYNTVPSFLKDVNSIPELEAQFSGIKAYITSPDVLKKIAIEVGLLSPNASPKSVQNLVKGLSKEITVTLSGKNLAEIKLANDDPKNMVPILQALGSNFMAEYLKPITAQAQSLALVLDKESQAQAQKLNASIQKVNEFKANKDQILPEHEAIYTNQLKSIIDSIAVNEANYNAALEDKKWLEKTFANANSELANLDREISENNTNLSEMKKIYAPNYPGIKEAEELAKKLKAEREKLYKETALASKSNPKLEKETTNPVSDVNHASLTEAELKKYQDVQQKIKILKENLNGLNKQKENLLESLRKINETENQLTLLSKTVAENQKAYDDLRKQYNLAKISTQLDYTDKLSPIKIVAAPQEPLYPTGSRPFILFFLVSFLAGLFLSVGLATVLDILNNRVRKKSTLSSFSKSPVLARVGNL